jgi:hypothetical protein
MLSHDFAKLLLKRRSHDLRFVAEVSLPGHDDLEDVCRTALADDRARAVGIEPPESILSYDSDDDMLDVALGPIFAGQQGSYYLNPQEALMALKAVETQMHLISHIGMDLACLEAFTQLRKRIKDAL